MTAAGDASRALRAFWRPRSGVCARCGTPFVRFAGAIYCSPRCAQRVHENAHRARMREMYSSWYAYLKGSHKPRPPRPKRRPR